MKTSVETVDPTTVKLTVEVEPKRVQKAFAEAAKHIAKDLSLPGFRAGKVPRKVIESRFGKDVVKQHALEDSLSEFYGEAVQSEKLAVVAQPEIDLKNFDEKEGCTFEATVQVAPEFEVPDHEGINLGYPEWDVKDEQIDEKVAELRERFAEVDVVERAAKTGDLVTINLTLSVDGEELEDAAVEDALYEVGSEGVTPKLDGELVGAEAGSEIKYTDALPEDYPEHGGKDADFVVTVKDVREKTLPALDDDFAMTASEFDTIDELRKDIRDNLLRRSIGQAQQGVRNNIIEAYLARVDIPLPQAMIDAEVEARMGSIKQQAEQYGMDMNQLLEIQGMDPEEFQTTAVEQSTMAVKGQLVLDALAGKLELNVEPADLDAEIFHQAQARGMDPQELANTVIRNNNLGMLAGDVLRRKAVDVVVAAAVTDGGPSDEVLIELGFMADPNAADDDDLVVDEDELVTDEG